MVHGWLRYLLSLRVVGVKMYTLTLNKRKFETHWLFGTIGAILMIPGFVAMVVFIICLLLILIPGVVVARIGARYIGEDDD